MFQLSPDGLRNGSGELKTAALKTVDPYHFFHSIPSFSESIQRNDCDDGGRYPVDTDIGLHPVHFLHTQFPMRRGLSCRETQSPVHPIAMRKLFGENLRQQFLQPPGSPEVFSIGQNTGEKLQRFPVSQQSW